MKIDLMKLAEQAGFTVMDWGQIRIKHSNGSWVSVTEQLAEFSRLVLANAAEDAKPVAVVGSKQGQTYFCYSVGESSVPVGTSFYAHPQPAPDVAALVEALERIGGVRTDYAAALAREALAAWKSQK